MTVICLLLLRFWILDDLKEHIMLMSLEVEPSDGTNYGRKEARLLPKCAKIERQEYSRGRLRRILSVVAAVVGYYAIVFWLGPLIHIERMFMTDRTGPNSDLLPYLYPSYFGLICLAVLLTGCIAHIYYSLHQEIRTLGAPPKALRGTVLEGATGTGRERSRKMRGVLKVIATIAAFYLVAFQIGTRVHLESIFPVAQTAPNAVMLHVMMPVYWALLCLAALIVGFSTHIHDSMKKEIRALRFPLVDAAETSEENRVGADEAGAGSGAGTQGERQGETKQ
jgi:hypothetical protein